MSERRRIRWFNQSMGERTTNPDPVNPHPRLVQYGLESMQGDPVEILHRHLTNNAAATIGGYKLTLNKFRELAREILTPLERRTVIKIGEPWDQPRCVACRFIVLNGGHAIDCAVAEFLDRIGEPEKHEIP